MKNKFFKSPKIQLGEVGPPQVEKTRYKKPYKKPCLFINKQGFRKN